MEDEENLLMYKQPQQDFLLFEIMNGPYYLVWWMIADIMPKHVRMCEKMPAMSCNKSLLKATDYHLKGNTFWYKVCDRCDLGITGDIRHIVMQCPFFDLHRRKMYDDTRQLGLEGMETILGRPQEIFYVLMGNQPIDIQFEVMIQFWLVTGMHIVSMYDEIITGRQD